MALQYLFEISSVAIAGGLFVLILGMIGLGYTAGRNVKRVDNRIDGQATAVQASMIGLLALLLGFTFSLALARFNERSVALVAEANAIGTAWLWTDLLSDQNATMAKDLLREYGAIRIEALSTATVERSKQEDLSERAEVVFASLWEVGVSEMQASPGPTALNFVTRLTDMADSRGELEAALSRHVPELVLVLLFSTFLIVGWVIGYASGTSGSWPRSPIFSMLVLITILLFIIIDLDRPRRGVITVDTTLMQKTVDAMGN